MASSFRHFLPLLLLLATVHSSSAGRKAPPPKDNDMYCESWRFSVETHNAGVFITVPSQCVSYVKSYMTDGRYASDAESAANDALTFAKNVTMGSDGKDAWVFDVDETLLSNLPYYAAHRYGRDSYNNALFTVWTDKGIAPAIPSSLRLHTELNNLGFKTFLLTGRSESDRNITKQNLIFAGYRNWAKLILRGESDEGTKAIVYKSAKRAELKKQGYRIHGSSGDQWSDLLGYAKAKRSFKIPNPMYYIG